ncbi:MAG: hypothetical protein K2Q21_09390 [Chitinophagaceae bacterium]|nr:hypothetical protein [Chitinophagaceae bacterium]
MNALKICYDFIKQNQKASIESYLCNSLLDVANIFNENEFPKDFVFADLSMGVWKANQVAKEFIEQLIIPTEVFTSSTINYGYQSQVSGSYLQFANIAGEGIDAESLGDTILNQCICYCNQMLQLLSHNKTQRIFVLILPLENMEVYKDNEVFIYFFSALIKKTNHKLIAINRSPTSNYPTINFTWTNKESFIKVNSSFLSDVDDIINLLPGVLNADILENKKHNLIALNNQHFLVPIEYRKLYTEITKLNFDKLANLFNTTEDVKAYALYNGNTYFIDGIFLSKYAWKQFGSGAKELAFKLLIKVYNSASNGTEKASILCQLQGLRIALWKFQEVAAAPMPGGNKILSVQRFLFMAKGWGAVMTGDLDNATICLSEATKLFSSEELASKEFMYLLNINALLLLKKDELAKAMLLEKQIENNVQINEIKDYKLRFVNAINLARLYKKNKEFTLSLQYYLKAFKTITGLKQESDFVYYNLILSNAYNDDGNSNKSFFCLLRSALNLLCTVFPKSVSKRLYVALDLPAIAQDEHRDTTEDIYNYFIKQICNHQYVVENFGQEIFNEFLDVSDTPFFLSSYLFDKKIEAALGVNGVSILVSDDTEESIHYKPKSKLGTIVFKILCIVFEDMYKLKQSKSIIIDTNYGFDIPQTIDEVVQVSIKLKVDKIIWEKNEFDLTAIKNCSLLLPTNISLHPGISHIAERGNDIAVSFKRYYPTLTINNSYTASLKKLLLGDLSLTTHEIEEISPDKLKWMQEKRIITLTYNTNEICKKAGSKLHLKEI